MEISRLSPLLPSYTSGAGTSADTTESTAAAATDFQSFLTLLTAQLRNQDPLQPLDSTAFVAQLASFSTVEQLIGTNERLDTLATQSETSDMAGLATWIGHQASATDGSFVTTGAAETFQVPTVSGATAIEAVVYLSDGTEIDRFAVTPNADGSAVWTAGAAMSAGVPVTIELVYSTGDLVIERQAAGVFREVTGIHGTSDGPVLDLADGGTLSPGEVAELRDGDWTSLAASDD